mmetsp:Transcript_35854/g.65782  ORF Transcript_35854/g.65782 Transcript_35854/m.65782 type:complete len:377 (+) Transcript_35854:78-1208(+)
MATTGSGRKVIVFGGLGQLGRRFVKILKDDPAYNAIVVADLRLPTKALESSMGGNKVTFVTHRLGEEPTENLVQILEGCDCVFSAVTAPLQQATPEQFQRTNVDGIKALVEGCKKSKSVKGLVMLSSIAVTDHLLPSVDMKESDPLPDIESYQSFYDKTKRLGEDIVLGADEKGGLRTCALRPSGILCSPQDHVFGNALGNGLPGFIFAPASPHPPMDFLDADDLSRAMMLAGAQILAQPDKVGGQAFFVTKGERINSLKIIELTARDLGWIFVPIPVCIFNVLVKFMAGIYNFRKCLGLSVKGVPDHLFWTFYRQQLTYDNSKAKDLLGYEPAIKIEETVKRILDQYRVENPWKIRLGCFGRCLRSICSRICCCN